MGKEERLYTHQRMCLSKMVENKEGFANFSEMGTGKTPTAIVGAENINAKRVLVLVPNSLKHNWAKEWMVWTEHHWDIAICDGTKQKKLKEIEKHRGSDRVVVIINYESVGTVFDELFKFGFDLLIADECHYLKTHNSQRTKHVKKLAERIRSKWIMTGTPTPNNPLDLYSQFDLIRPKYLSTNFYSFRSKYANVYTGAGFPMIRGFRNQEELQKKIARFSVRMIKDLCLDLPDKVYQTISIPLKKKTALTYKELLAFMVTEVGDAEISATTVLTKILRLQQITGGFVKSDDGEEVEVGTEKIDALKELVESLQGEKLVIWARFTKEIKMIETMLRKIGRTPLIMTGETPVEDRNDHVNKFQNINDPNLVIVANIAVGGVGLTLTESKYCIYYSRTFSFGEARQSEDRQHRIGQKHKVTYYDLVCEGTIDEYILKAIRKKETLSNKVTGDDLKRIAAGRLPFEQE